MDRAILVYVDLNRTPHLAGRLWAHTRKGKASATFEYDETWLGNPGRFSLDPLLTLDPGPFHTSDKALFGALGDSAPDRWGRVLMRRAERRRAEQAGETPRTLQEIDYLLMVNDEARLGALRFALEKSGPFLAAQDAAKIPPLIDLPKLLSAAEHFADETDTGEDLRLLLAPGSSLGGARPKASVRDKDGHLCIAKFPHKDDETNVVLWEAVALTLAKKSGIEVPAWRIETVGRKQVLLLRRFDRAKSTRIPFLSAMSMLGAKDNETHSYLEIADALRRYGAAPRDDLRALWRRMLFNILIANTDDHLRNHAFLYEEPNGWRLSPAYDLNPVPTDIKPRILSTAITEDDGTGSVELALRVAEYFGLNEDEARAIINEVRKATATWQKAAARLGLSALEIERMESAFKHHLDPEAVTAKKLSSSVEKIQ
jgi:serine/threonine-protein kinase HipA